MNIVLVPYTFYPDHEGGTEVYVAALARHLLTSGHHAVVAAPSEHSAAYTHERLPVRRFAASRTDLELREMYGEGDPHAAIEFGHILDEEQPDLVHLHAFTSGVSVRLVREAKRRNLPVVFTYHTPTVSCQRGTLLRWGSDVCNGKLDLRLCSRCTLHGLGMGRAASTIVGSVPVAAGKLLGAAGRAGGVWTALRMTELVQLRHAAFRALMAEVDHVVAVCQWVKDVLLLNGVPSRKISLSRQGLTQEAGNSNAPRDSAQYLQTPLRVAFLGRLDPTKGPDLLVQAIRSLPEAAIELDIYGIAQGATGAAYQQYLVSLANGDPRIRFLSPIPSSGVVGLLKIYHVLAVPSRILETGPLVVLEAFGAGIPVLGSRLGGIAELVEDGVNGLLVAPDSVDEWSQALRRVAEDRHLLARLRAGIRPPRTMATVTEEMMALYGRLVDKPPTVSIIGDLGADL